MRLLKVGDVELGVVVQGLEALVSQELLDVVQVGVALDHLACATPPEGVRRDLDIETELTAVFPDTLTHGVLRQCRAMIGKKHRVRCPAFRQVRPHATDVGSDPLQGRLADRNEALLPALPYHPGNAMLKVKVGERKPFQFADPDAAGVKKLDGGAVPYAGRRAGVDLAQELAHLGMSENAAGKQLRFLDVCQVSRQGAIDVPVFVEQIEEDPCRLDDGVDGCRFQRQAMPGQTLAQVRLEGVYVGDVQSVGGGDAVMFVEIINEEAQGGPEPRQGVRTGLQAFIPGIEFKDVVLKCLGNG